MIYPPREDSELLARWVRRLASGKVLDMGTGSGIQAQTAAARKPVKSVLAVDVDPDVIAHCKSAIAGKRVRCLRSDLFSRIPRQRFDTIIFNPPYLPQESLERDIALEGGKRGHETLVRFLESANPFLKTDGIMLVLFSSLTNKPRIEHAIRQQLFDFTELDRLHIFFEDLFVYKITKSPLLKRIERAGVRDLAYLARGKRSWVLKGAYRGNACVVKVKRPGAAANAPANEGRMLRIVNKLGLGPRLFAAAKDFVVYEYVAGAYLADILAKAGKMLKQRLFRQLFAQAFVLDQAGLAKEEMLRPLRNAIVTPRGKVVLIDFERAHKSKKAHNVTQLCTFAAREGIAPLTRIRRLAAQYKRKPSPGSFRALLEGMDL
jgi:HemK-related putative methylase